MLRDVKATTNQDGSLSEEQFLEFLRTMLVKDLPLPLIDQLVERYNILAAESPDGKLSVAGAEAIIYHLGFASKKVDTSTAEIMTIIDADHSNTVALDELLMCIGMLYKIQDEMMTLGSVFKRMVHGGSKWWKRKSYGEDLLEAALDSTRHGQLTVPRITEILDCTAQEAEDLVYIGDFDRFKNDADIDEWSLHEHDALINLLNENQQPANLPSPTAVAAVEGTPRAARQPSRSPFQRREKSEKPRVSSQTTRKSQYRATKSFRATKAYVDPTVEDDGPTTINLKEFHGLIVGWA